jgi:hypothetical protein
VSESDIHKHTSYDIQPKTVYEVVRRERVHVSSHNSLGRGVNEKVDVIAQASTAELARSVVERAAQEDIKRAHHRDGAPKVGRGYADVAQNACNEESRGGILAGDVAREPSY